MVVFHARPPSPVSKLQYTGKAAKEKQLDDAHKGAGEEPNYTTAKKPGPL